MASPDFPNKNNPVAPSASGAPVWPRFGTSLEAVVIAFKYKVFVDATFIKSPQFPNFSKTWTKMRTEQFTNRFYFLPSYELQKLTAEEKSRINPEDVRIIKCADLADCFVQLQQMELNWMVLWLTGNSKYGLEVQTAAKKNCQIPLRWYGLDTNSQLAPLFDNILPGTPAPRPAQPQRPPVVAPVTEAVTISRAANPPRAVPVTGIPVTASNLNLRLVLREPVMTDHCSITYKTDNPGYFAKIYTAQALQANLFENKARHMLSMDVQIPGVCWPKSLLLDITGAFVGILVPASNGIQLSRSVLSGVNAMNQHFSTWDKRSLCELAMTMLRTIAQLHAAGIRFGCFNPASVYVCSSQKVCFVDTDMWQFGGYPVISRNITFTPPELLTNKAKLHLYTDDEENYQIALLVFMIMLPGKYPYAKRNSRSHDENLQNRSFPFSIGDDMRRSADAERPSGPWQIAWDHLPYQMCSKFYHTFHPKGDHALPGKRLPVSVWATLVKDFYDRLQTPAGYDSRELFPKTFRKDGKRTFYRCSICHQEHPSFYFLRKIRLQGEQINIWDKGYRVCLPCAVDQSKDASANFTCQRCKRKFYYTNRAKIMHEIGKEEFDWSNQKWCKDCKSTPFHCPQCGRDVPIHQVRTFHDRVKDQDIDVCSTCCSNLINAAKQRKNEYYTSGICRRCKRHFVITVGDAEYFYNKHNSLPEYCPNCRRR
jgi:hypothetical protein